VGGNDGGVVTKGSKEDEFQRLFKGREDWHKKRYHFRVGLGEFLAGVGCDGEEGREPVVHFNLHVVDCACFL